MKLKPIFIFILLVFSINIFSQTVNESFVTAVYENDELKIFDMMRRGADANSISSKGISALMYAVQNGNYLIAEKLLKAGANPDYQTKTNPPVIVNAIINKDTAIVYLLLEYGANPNIVDKEQKKIPLLYAIDINNFVITDLLLWYGADPNLSSNDQTPLFHAIDYNADTSIVNLLIDSGADINHQNSLGFSPLIEAVFYNNITIVKILLENEAKTDIVDNTSQEYNALDYAYKYHLEDITKLLLPYYKNDAKKYHAKALTDDYQAGAREIRDLTQKKYLSPVVSKIIVSPSVLFTYNDFFMGGKIGFKESRYNFETDIGILPRLFEKRILIEDTPNNYLQLWEKRTMLFFEVNKNFNISYTDENITGIYLKAGGNFSFGEYNGIRIDYQKPFVYSFGAGIWTKKDFTKVSFGYEYLPIQTNFPHFIKLDIAFLIPFHFSN